MPILDRQAHDADEDLRVLRDALGPARGPPQHAGAMREAAADARRRRRSEREARRRRRHEPADG
ncbi:MAG: hypothetical protein ACFE0R_20165 [Salinarimonas sp.]